MTVHAAAVERQLGRPVMPRFFAAFSLGTVAGAAVGVLMTALRVPVSIHVAVVATVIAGAVPAAARHFLPEHAARPIAVPPPVRMSRPGLGAWREPRTVAVGLVALAFAVAEGAAVTGSASRSSTVTTSPPRSARWPAPPSSPRSPPAAGSGQRSSNGSTSHCPSDSRRRHHHRRRPFRAWAVHWTGVRGKSALGHGRGAWLSGQHERRGRRARSCRRPRQRHHLDRDTAASSADRLSSVSSATRPLSGMPCSSSRSS